MIIEAWEEEENSMLSRFKELRWEATGLQPRESGEIRMSNEILEQFEATFKLTAEN